MDLEKVKAAVDAMNKTIAVVTDRNPFSYKVTVDENGKQRVFITLTLPHVGSIIEREVMLDENPNPV